MAKTITLTFSDAIFTRMVKALSSYFGWTAMIPNPDGLGSPIPNPVTRKDFLLSELRRWLLDIARDAEINASTQQAVEDAATTVQAAREAAQATANEMDLTITNG